jgi:hypothetical protein
MSVGSHPPSICPLDPTHQGQAGSIANNTIVTGGIASWSQSKVKPNEATEGPSEMSGPTSPGGGVRSLLSPQEAGRRCVNGSKCSYGIRAGGEWALSEQSEPPLYNLGAYSYPTRIPYTQTLHSYPTLTPYTHTLHSHPTLIPYTHTLHSYPPRIPYTHTILTLYPHCTRTVLTHTGSLRGAIPFDVGSEA